MNSKYKDMKKRIVVLDNVRSALNVGVIFRTCDAFAVEALFLCGITAKPPHRDIHKTALGATQHVQWSYFDHVDQALHTLKEKGFYICAMETARQAIPLHTHALSAHSHLALCLGHEVQGISPCTAQNADKLLYIPQQGQKRSLNVAVATGIALWHAFSGTEAEIDR